MRNTILLIIGFFTVIILISGCVNNKKSGELPSSSLQFKSAYWYPLVENYCDICEREGRNCDYGYGVQYTTQHLAGLEVFYCHFFIDGENALLYGNRTYKLLFRRVEGGDNGSLQGSGNNHLDIRYDHVFKFCCSVNDTSLDNKDYDFCNSITLKKAC